MEPGSLRQTMKTIWPTDDLTSARMKRVRRSDTAPEQRVRDAIRATKIRFSTALQSVVGTPDFCSKKHQWAVFVHGCFWHGHANCSRSTLPLRNRALWLEKIQRNKARDRRVVRMLREQGYAVLVIWECQTYDSNRLLKILFSFFSNRVPVVWNARTNPDEIAPAKTRTERSQSASRQPSRHAL